MIAYMNGYYQALQLDIEEIKKLQDDKDILKRKVKAAGGKYTNLIDIMNPSKFGDAEGYKGYKEREVSGEGNPKYWQVVKHTFLLNQLFLTNGRRVQRVGGLGALST